MTADQLNAGRSESIRLGAAVADAAEGVAPRRAVEAVTAATDARAAAVWRCDGDDVRCVAGTAFGVDPTRLRPGEATVEADENGRALVLARAADWVVAAALRATEVDATESDAGGVDAAETARSRVAAVADTLAATTRTGSEPDATVDGTSEGLHLEAADTTAHDHTETADSRSRDSGAWAEEFASVVPVGFWVVDTEHTELLYHNEAAAELYGLTDGVSDPRQFTDNVVREDLHELTRAARDADADGWTGPLHREFRVNHPERGRRWLAVAVHPVYDDDETVAYLAGIVRDVTERRRRERSLRAERERFRLLTTAVEEYAFLTVDADGTVTAWNDGARETFGHDETTAVGASFERLFAPAARQADTPAALLAAASVDDGTEQEAWLRRADGTTFRGDVRVGPLATDSSVEGEFAVVVRDTTEVRRERRRTERLLSESSEAVLVVDREGRIDYVAGAVRRQFGYDPESLLGQDAFQYLHPDCRGELVSALADILAGDDERATHEVRVRRGPHATSGATDGTTDDPLVDHHDDDWLAAEVRLRDLTDDDAVSGVLVYLRDVTAARRRARQFRRVFDASFQSVLMLSPDGRVLELNESAQSFIGVDDSGETADDPAAPGTASATAAASDATKASGDRAAASGDATETTDGGVERLRGIHFADLDWWEDDDTARQVAAAVDRAAEDGRARLEARAVGTTGFRTFDFVIEAVSGTHGEPALLVAEGQDVTARRRGRQQLCVLQRILRHNVRNDVTKLRGWTQLLAESDDGERRRQILATVESVLDRWTSITENVRRIREVLSRDPLTERHRPVSELLTETVRAAARRHRETAFETGRETDPAVGDVSVPESVGAAVRELLDNAAAVTDVSRVRVVLAGATPRWLTVAVTDDGPGLPSVEASVLETGEETPLEHGRGFGLWTVRTLVTRAGGDVTVDTDDGTTVRLRLPRVTPRG